MIPAMTVQNGGSRMIGTSSSPLLSSNGAKVALFFITGIAAITAMEATRVNSPLAAFWPVNGIALVALLRLDSRLQGRLEAWAAIASAIFLANMMCGNGLARSGLFTLANLSEIALAYVILRTRLGRISSGKGPFATIIPCMMGAAVLAPALSTFVLAGGLALTPISLDIDLVRAWWLPDVLGLLIVVPLGLSVTRHALADLRTEDGMRAALIGAGVLAALLIAIAVWDPFLPVFLIAPLAMVAAVRFRALGVAVTIAAAAWFVLPLVGANDRGGSALIADATDRITLLQAHLVLSAVLALGVSALLEERAAITRVLEERERAAAEAAQARLRLLMNVAHEIRTPLNVILGCADLVRGAGPMSDQQGQLIDATTASARQLQVLASDLLETARLEHCAATLNPLAVSPLAVIEAAIADVRAALSWDGTVSVAIGCETVWADPQRFRQVATNLISNAAKYGGAYGPIRIQMHESEHCTSLVVADCGPGLPPGREHEVFEPFSARTEQITSASAGVGLSLVKQLVEAHGGQVRCNSSPYIETRFEAIFPLQSSAAAQTMQDADIRSVDPESVF